jgi:sulfonate transport system ATP-binding protein
MDMRVTEIAEETLARGVAIGTKQVVKRFGKREVLHGLDLDIAPGEFIAVVGRSGCGKSTFLRLLAGLEQASGGGITLDGKPLSGIQPDVRIMFQDARLLPWRTVIQNVGLGLGGDWQATALDALRQVGLEDRAHDWPATLSGGQRQRVALARALIHKPRLLLLDEPLGALDALTRIEMQRLIERLWLKQGFTALLVTHDVAEAVALADRVLLIENGSITLDQPVALPRRRERGSPAFAELEGRVLAQVMGVDSLNARNQFRGRIAAINDEDPILAEVQVDTGFGLVTATVETRALAEAGLGIGSEVLAFVKSNEVSLCTQDGIQFH